MFPFQGSKSKGGNSENENSEFSKERRKPFSPYSESKVKWARKHFPVKGISSCLPLQEFATMREAITVTLFLYGYEGLSHLIFGTNRGGNFSRMKLNGYFPNELILPGRTAQNAKQCGFQRESKVKNWKVSGSWGRKDMYATCD